MATKRKRTSEQHTSTASDARADKPERRPTPRKRTDAPAKAPRPGKIERVTDAGLPPKPDASGPVKTVRARTAPRAAAPAAAADPGASASFDAVDEGEKKPRTRTIAAKKRRRKWPFVVVGAILALVLATAGLLAWDRWYRFDDAAEIQGEWQVHGSTGVVVIDGQSIKLTEDVTWSYTMDTGAKTLSYTFGNMEGQGRYRFSLDRSQLVIMDGSGFTWLSTLLDDISWMADQAVLLFQGRGPEETVAGDSVIVVDRLSHDASALPRTGAATEPAADDGADSDGAADTGTAAEGADQAAGQEGASTGDGADADAGNVGEGAVGGAADAGSTGDATGTGNAAGAADAGGAGDATSAPGSAFDVSDRSA